ncbi:MAG: HNH endonuclease [Sphingobacterium sp.]|jgi:uncharacterized protein (TIGR02646 family)|uniref:HNH endonuclease n=1 Tax=Sphingobacterium sp. TaxID=341027 RepID=UPI00284F20AC|nr:HNH endonuclease [Sphingobacterium sp.]MDR3009460.1 HNH endonuclease [Sphingobacterium sp.]
MIKINKDLSAIPNSLRPPTLDYFPVPSRPSTACRTTHLRRQEIIENNGYINREIYNSRYKYSDVKNALRDLYYNKCGFCEQRIEISHVEHFRPKSDYYWLAYSWDNLILSCASCNSNKGDRFAIEGIQHRFVFDPDSTYSSIHVSSAQLDQVERPMLLNPEVDNLTSEFIFDENGGVRSNHPRVSHSISECKLSRHDLKYQRKKLIDDFKSDIEAALLLDNKDEQILEISAFVKQFLRRANSSDESFIAFRKYAINNHWLSNIIKSLN